MADTVDLDEYIKALARRWKVILGSVLACVAIAAVLVLAQPRMYRSQVLVAAVSETERVSLDTGIETLADDQLSPKVDRGERLASFVQMVSSPAIEQEVLKKIGDRLPAGVRRVGALLGAVGASLAKGSDSIVIAATHRDPNVASLLADAWAREYVRQVNQTFSGVGEESRATINRKVVDAREAYEQERESRETDMRMDRTGELEVRITQHEALLRNLLQLRDAALRKPFEDLQTLSRLLEASRDLRAQLIGGGPAAARSSGPAIALLKAQALGIGTTDSVTLQITLQEEAVGATTEEKIADLEALISILEARRDAALSDMSAVLSAAPQEGYWPPVDSDQSTESVVQTLQDELLELRIQLDRVRDRLTQGRTRLDLARQTYESLLAKEAELALAKEVAGSVVRIAAPVTRPAPTRRSQLWSIPMAAFAGLMAGVILAWALEFFEGYRRRTAGGA